jgi:hypothetical protein
MLDEFTLKTDLSESVTTVSIHNDELIVELPFIMVLPLTTYELIIVIPLFKVVIPEPPQVLKKIMSLVVPQCITYFLKVIYLFILCR